MFAIREGKVNVRGHMVPTFARTIYEAKFSILAEAGSNGLYGDSGCGSYGRSYVSLLCDAPDVSFCPIKSRDGRVIGVEILGCGDEARYSMTAALDFVTTALQEAQVGEDMID